MEDGGGKLKVGLHDVKIQPNHAMVSEGMKPGDYVHIIVSDTGIGMTPEVLETIYDPYFTTKPPGEGTGLGLSVVHGIVESYGGKISVESTKGVGSSFSIWLPITKKRQLESAYKPEMLPVGRERVLLVDDEPSIAKIGAQILKRLGYAVTTRTSSIEALELFRSKSNYFDLVITDMTMPNMTGDALARELIKIRFDIPVILCTGYSNKISEAQALDMGIKAIAYKPIIRSELAKTVRQLLDEHQGGSNLDRQLMKNNNQPRTL